jgi:hypothetical protein
MKRHTRVGMTTKELDDIGEIFLNSCGAVSAPKTRLISRCFPPSYDKRKNPINHKDLSGEIKKVYSRLQNKFIGFHKLDGSSFHHCQSPVTPTSS